MEEGLIACGQIGGDWLEAEYNKLTGKYKHYCLDWDGLPVDETCPEFECCTCYRRG